MRIGVRSKIFLSIFLVVMLFTMLVDVVLRIYLIKAIEDGMIDALTYATKTYLKYDKQRSELLLAKASLAAQSAHLIATLSIPDVDSATVQYAISFIEQGEFSDFFLIANADGKVLANVNEKQVIDDIRDYEGVKDIFQGAAQVSGRWRLKGNSYYIALVPILRRDLLVGLSVIGQRINVRKRLMDVADLIDAEVYFYDKNDVLYLSEGESLDWASKQNSARVRVSDEIFSFDAHGEKKYCMNYSLGRAIGYLMFCKSDAKLMQYFREIENTFILIASFTVGLAVLVSLVVSVRLSKPIMNLIKILREFGAGDFSRRLPVTTRDEVGDLVVAFNTMADDLVEGREKLLDREIAEKKMRELAFTDFLTGLGNRLFFVNQLETALIDSAKNKINVALFFVDLDGFKQVNDTLGHEIGDLLLKQVAHRLRYCVREDTQLSRLGGDEFTLVFENIPNQKVCGKIAKHIIDVLSKPYALTQHRVVVTASVGIAMAREGQLDLDTLLRHADKAMYDAKQKGKNTYSFYVA